MRAMAGVLGAVCALARPCLAEGAGGTDGQTAGITLDAKDPGAVISPLLFGHNLEVTRRAVWSGLSAEMVANRKFAAVDHGMPRRWWTLPGSHVDADDKEAYAGQYSVRLETRDGEAGSGIWQQQEWLSFQKGRRYAFRVWMKSDSDQRLSMRIMPRSFFQPVFSGSTESRPDAWHLWSGEFVAPTRAQGAALELRCSKPGVLWIGAVSVMPADHFHGMRRDVVDHLKTLKPGLLRWPGGCFAEYYPWQDGLLPVDQRPPVGPGQWRGLLPDSDDYDNHDMGTDEFLALCRELNCAPAITVRYGGGGSPGEAAGWVEYCNGGEKTRWGKVRAERGHPEPYRVKYWFVGNEVWGMSLVEDKSVGACAVRSRQFADAMRGADPDIRRIHCAPMDSPGWADQTLKNLKESPDFTELVQDGWYFPTGDVRLSEALRAPTRTIAPRLRRIRQALDQAGEAGRRTGIAFYEWNVMWDRPGDSLAGFFAAGMLNLFCREAEPLGLELAGYFQPVSEGAIRVEPTSSRIEPAGEVFVLYSVHQGNRLVKIPDANEAADLDICASLTPDGETMYVTVVNRSLTDDRALELALNDFIGRPEAEVKLLVQDDAGGFSKREGKLTVAGGRTVTCEIPRCGIARLRLERQAEP
jgi:alpha-L-arabinofuranosidase